MSGSNCRGVSEVIFRSFMADSIRTLYCIIQQRTSHLSSSHMEAAAGASTMNAIAATSAPLRRRTPTPLPWNHWNPLNSRRCAALKGTTFFSITHCSTRPGTNINNEQDQSNPNPKSPQKPRSLSDKDPSPPPPLSSPQSPSHSRGLVFDVGSVNSWDSAEIGSPVVKRFLSDDEERWYMWYYGRQPSGSDSIGLAVSSNGVHWERSAAPVMKCGNDWWVFDTFSIRPCEVVVMSSSKVRASSSVYWLYYTGYSHEKVNTSMDIDLANPERFCGEIEKDRIFRSLPGLAMSQDGKNWARIEGEHHSGALLDVGSDNEWDPLFVTGAKVVFHGNGDLRMYYHSLDVETGGLCIGLARSRDGIKWVKLGKVLCGAANPHVVRNNGKDGKLEYLMVYEGIGGDGKRSIELAVSSDGLKEWRRVREEPILEVSEGGDSWDCVGVGSPYLVRLDGDENEWRLYYRGVGSGGRTGIGMAVSEGSDITSFRRWTGFHV